MKILNQRTLDEFRTRGPCSWCARVCRVREPHHWYPKGMGNSSQLDVQFNLIAVGSSQLFQCDCHTRMESGEIYRGDVLAKIAALNGLLQDPLERAIYLLVRLDKSTPLLEAERLVSLELGREVKL